LADQNAEQQQIDYQNFVKDMASQAETLVPVDISQEDKKYVVQIVYNFGNLACEAILKEKFQPQEVILVTQLIGEWTFHKSIDLIRAKIPPQYRDGILQSIAFTVFEITKQAILKKLTQEQIIQVAEHHVKQKYMSALNELKEKNLISPNDYDSALGQSNVEQMTQEPEQLDESSSFSDSKILKLLTFAMVLKKMPPEKAKSILSKMSPKEAEVVSDYMKVDDLSSKIDAGITMKYISEIKNNVPQPDNVNSNKLQHKLAKIVTKKNEIKINDIISQERDGIKKYVTSINEKRQSQLPTRISNIVYTYLVEKLTV